MLEKRGRKSAADLESVVIPVELPNARPEPPADLSPREAEIWRGVVSVMPPRHFGRERWPVLIGYCRHVIAAEAAWQMYSDALHDPSAGAKELTRLQIMHTRETDGVRHSSRHLGLLQVGRSYRKVPRYAPTPPPAPWEG